MADAGFFRGTSADQDNRFANKQKKLLKELNFSPILNTKLNMSKINLDNVKPWIEEKIKYMLEKEDDILSESIYEHLAEKDPDGKTILVWITGFLDEAKASKFMEELWTKLLDLQEVSNGLRETEVSRVGKNDNGDEHKLGIQCASPKHDMNNEANQELVQAPSESDHQIKSLRNGENSCSESLSARKDKDIRQKGPPSPRPGTDGEVNRSRSNSRSPGSKKERTSRSRSRSCSSSESKRSGSRSCTRSRSKSEDSRPGSRSKSRTRSKTRSRSRELRSPRSRSRSPHRNLYRGRRSRTPTRGYRRSRSPRSRGGYIPRGPYRGYQHDRRRGPLHPMRRRPSPRRWFPSRTPPRSPIRRRRSPSYSPRRRTPPPYFRRHSRSRSPHMIPRRGHIGSPRHGGSGHMDMLGSHFGTHHDIYRPIVPRGRSPRMALDHHHRHHSDRHLTSRHSPLPPIGKSSDLGPSAHGMTAIPPGPLSPGPHSPSSSSKKKHKKVKKHRKHKKSKSKHRSSSSSPDSKKKKHKKHKKSKKHKSH